MLVVSSEGSIEENRGFSPSDIKDPGKREFLTQLRKDENKDIISEATL